MKSRSFLVSIIALSVLNAGVFAGLNLGVNPISSGVEQIDLEEIVNGVTYEFKGSVEYDVYAPGDYSGSLPLPANHFVYAYRLNNLNGDSSGLDITLFALGLIPGSAVAEENVTSMEIAAGDIAPMGKAVSSQQAFYTYILDTIGAGESSQVMLISSPFGPVEGFGAVMVAGGLGIVGSEVVALPTPVPEPVSLFLLGAGGLCVRSIRRIRLRA